MQVSEALLLRKGLVNVISESEAKSKKLKKVEAALADTVAKYSVRIDRMEREFARSGRTMRRLQKDLERYKRECTCAASHSEGRQAADVVRALEYYGNENNPSSDSLYNDRRRRIREAVGSYLDGEAEGRKKGPIGPPLNHKGYSHKLKPSVTCRYYVAECGYCGPSDTIRLRPSVKIFCELRSNEIFVATIVAGRLYCAKCKKITAADSPAIPGTMLGPNFLRMVIIYVHGGAVDSVVADYIRGIHGIQISTNGVGNARHATVGILERAMPTIQKHIVDTASYIGRDESPVRYNAHKGYAWIVVTPDAVYCVVVGSRASTVLDIHFSAFRGIPSVTDEFPGYKRLENRQSDWIHILRKAEKCGIDGSVDEFALYLRLLNMYREIKRWDTTDGETIGVLADQVLQMAREYGEGHKMYTVLINALPTMFTFLRIKGMPPTATQQSRSFIPITPDNGEADGRSKTKRARRSSAPSPRPRGHAASLESRSGWPFCTCSATGIGTFLRTGSFSWIPPPAT